MKRRLPFVARTRPSAMSAVWSLSGVNRTWRGQPNSVENDPKRTSEANFAVKQNTAFIQRRGKV